MLIVCSFQNILKQWWLINKIKITHNPPFRHNSANTVMYFFYSWVSIHLIFFSVWVLLFIKFCLFPLTLWAFFYSIKYLKNDLRVTEYSIMDNIFYNWIFLSLFSYLPSQWTSSQINLCSYLINFFGQIPKIIELMS